MTVDNEHNLSKGHTKQVPMLVQTLALDVCPILTKNLILQHNIT